MDNLLSREEVHRFLEIEEDRFERLITQGKLHAYKVGGTYLRFRKDEVLALKQELYSGKKNRLSVPWFVRVSNFWRFNNFYILSLLLVALLFLVILRF